MPDRQPAQISRREAIQLLSVSTGAWFLAACTRVESTPSTTAHLQTDTPAPTITATATPAVEVEGLSALPDDFAAGRLTPIKDFYVQNYNGVAKPDAFNWALSLVGLIDNKLSLSLLQIKQRRSVERMQTLECIGNPVSGNLIGNTNWVGISMRDLLLEAGVQPEARYLHFFCEDDYFTSVPIELGLDERSMLAYKMGDDELTAAHGSPLRALFPGVYGQKQPKWIISIRADKADKPGTWEERGWSNEAIIKVNSKVETPRVRQSIPAGEPFYLTGWAMANTSGVQSIEVSTDDGNSWQAAEMLPGQHAGVWTLWHWVWENPTPGTHILVARATDGQGIIQTAGGSASGLLDNVFPDGSSLMHRVPVNVVAV